MAGEPVAGPREPAKLAVREARRHPLAQTPARLPLPPPRVARKHPLDPF
jgi:hypothetical protein